MQTSRNLPIVPMLIATQALACASLAFSAPVSDFVDVTFWVGTGDNEAAMVVDWDEDSSADESLVWGYRWTGSAKGSDMLRAIVEADDRLFVKVDSSGEILFGMGYDLTGDGLFEIDDGTFFDEHGIAISGVPDPFPPFAVASSVDSGDRYREGWRSGFWHYGISDGATSPYAGGSWVSDEQGMAERILSDGDWDSWAFMRLPLPPEQPMPPFDAYAENPHAAEPPLTADFDLDGDVDGADLLVWQRGFGSQTGAAVTDGDANADGVVDEADLQIWTSGFGAMESSSAPLSAAVVVPEPSSIACICSFVFFLVSRFSFTT